MICTDGAGTTGPNSGSYWSWLGGVVGSSEVGGVSQSVPITLGGPAALSAYTWHGSSSFDPDDISS